MQCRVGMITFIKLFRGPCVDLGCPQVKQLFQEGVEIEDVIVFEVGWCAVVRMS